MNCKFCLGKGEVVFDSGPEEDIKVECHVCRGTGEVIFEDYTCTTCADQDGCIYSFDPVNVLGNCAAKM